MAGRLSKKRVDARTEPGRYGDGNGLYLSVSKWGTRSWVLRYQLRGKSHEMGLGPYPLISLAEARQRVEQWRKLKLDGIDPARGSPARSSAPRPGWRRRRRSALPSAPTATSRRMKAGGAMPSTNISGGKPWTSPAKPWAICRWPPSIPGWFSKCWSQSGLRRWRRRSDCAGASKACWTWRPRASFALAPTRRAGVATSITC